MLNKLKYVKQEDLRDIDDYSLAIAMLEKEKVIIDAFYLPIMEVTERGNLLVLCDI